MKKVLSVIALACLFTSCGLPSRNVFFRARRMNYNPLVNSLTPVNFVSIESVDSAFHTGDTVLLDNEHFLLLERTK